MSLLLSRVLRGVLGFALAAAAFHLHLHPIVTILAVIAALIAWGGCPLCWTFGIVDAVCRIPNRNRDQQ